MQSAPEGRAANLFLTLAFDEHENEANYVATLAPLECDQGDSDEDSLLQLHSLGMKRQKTVLSLDHLIPHQTAVVLIDAVSDHLLPTPLAVEIAGTVPAEQIQQELQAWSHRRVVYPSLLDKVWLCLPADYLSASLSDHIHYLFCHDDVQDPHGIFKHSCLTDMHERTAHDLSVSNGVHSGCVLFHHREPQVSGAPGKHRIPTPWPERGTHARTSKQLCEAEFDYEPARSCTLRTSFGPADIEDFFKSGHEVLCTDLSGIPLENEIKEHLEKYDIKPINCVSDLDQYDRLCIFMDVSSRQKMRRFTPDHADALWAMLLCSS